METTNVIEPVVEHETQEASLKPQKVKVQERTIEELEHAAVKTMSEKELKKYIDYLRDTKTSLCNQLTTLKDAFSGVQKQKQVAEEELKQYKLAANTQIQFCKDTLAQAFKAVHYMAPLEV
jgi:archaellum component FlaC